MNNQKILEKFLNHIWLFENVFWKFTNTILYDAKKERIKLFLFELYWKKDVYELFPPELDEYNFNKSLNALTTYYEPIDEWKTK